MLIKLLIFRGIALTCAAGTVLLVARYPLGWMALAALLGTYAAVLWHRPHWWLYALPALLPVLNLYPWTGWLFIEEFDLFVLTTVAVGYWRASTSPPSAKITPLGSTAIALLAISYIVSALLPLRELEHWNWATLATYNTPLNSLRVLKGFLWPLLLLPLLLRAADAFGPGFRDALMRGMLAGLTLASAVVLWERNAFPGVMNFSSNYRAIGSFFEAHVGGAALDGHLALSLPFALVYLLTARTLRTMAMGAAILMLGTYATFATFSRGLYAGIAVAVGLIAAVTLVRQPRATRGFRSVALLIALAVCCLMLLQVFATGGYRTLAAALGAYAAAAYIGGTTRPPNWSRTLIILLGLSLATLAFVQFVPKGAYLIYGISGLVAGALATLDRLGHLSRMEFVFAACAWLGLNTIAVGWHWGGAPAAQDAALAIAVAVALALYNQRSPAPLWVLSWRMASTAIAGGLLIAIAIPVLGNYFMKERVRAVSQDLQGREDHWQGSIDMRGDDPLHAVFGAGLGSYPDSYFWKNHKGEFPGVVTFMSDTERHFVRLGRPRAAPGRKVVEPLRLAQRIAIASGQKLTLHATLRSELPKTVLTVNVCEKWLLYTERCSRQPAHLRPAHGEWSSHTTEFHMGTLGTTYWWGKRSALLTMTVSGRSAIVDVSDVRLFDQNGNDLIQNGELIHGGDHWYFTSDHSHLPWHAKNLWLGIWFDQGWFGLASFTALLAALLVAGWSRTQSGRPGDDALTAGIGAFLVVGLFDTLLDATRLAVLFYLLSYSALVIQARSSSWRTRSDPFNSPP